MMKLLWIITYPLSLFLDWLLGADHMKFYEKNDLKALIELHEIKKREKKEHGHDEGHGHDVFYLILI